MGKSFLEIASRAVVAAAAAVACMGAQAADVTVGQSFWLTWDDQTGVVLPGGLTDATLAIGFDASVLQLTQVAAGDLFGAGATATVYAGPFAVPPLSGDFYAVSIAGGDGNGQKPSVLWTEFTVLAKPASGVTSLYLLDATDPDAAPGLPASYYQFAQGQQINLSVAAVPEPATVSSLLAGLALVGGLMARRRQMTRQDAA